jgi:uncharacterized protein (TIGR02145 family)
MVVVKFSLVTMLMIVALSSAGELADQSTQVSPQLIEVGLFIDHRDGTAYRTVRLGSQHWLGENVRFAVEGSWVYGGNLANLEEYGRLYDWEGACRACPPGWHLPTAAEWGVLFNYLGGSEMAGGSLKEAGTERWKSPNTGATNSSQFDGRPGGGRRPEAGTFHGLGMFGAFWSRTEQGEAEAWAFFLGYHYAEISARESISKGFGSSVRCVHDHKSAAHSLEVE